MQSNKYAVMLSHKQHATRKELTMDADTIIDLLTMSIPDTDITNDIDTIVMLLEQAYYE